jgi:hypothetical protein
LRKFHRLDPRLFVAARESHHDRETGGVFGRRDGFGILHRNGYRFVQIDALAMGHGAFDRFAVPVRMRRDNHQGDKRMGDRLLQRAENLNPVRHSLFGVQRVEVLGRHFRTHRDPIEYTNDAESAFADRLSDPAADEIDTALARTDDGDTLFRADMLHGAATPSFSARTAYVSITPEISRIILNTYRFLLQ